MAEPAVRFDHLAAAVGLNIVYLAIGAALFLYSFPVARQRGLLMKLGE